MRQDVRTQGQRISACVPVLGSASFSFIPRAGPSSAVAYIKDVYCHLS